MLRIDLQNPGMGYIISIIRSANQIETLKTWLMWQVESWFPPCLGYIGVSTDSNMKTKGIRKAHLGPNFKNRETTRDGRLEIIALWDKGKMK